MPALSKFQFCFLGLYGFFNKCFQSAVGWIHGYGIMGMESWQYFCQAFTLYCEHLFKCLFTLTDMLDYLILYTFASWTIPLKCYCLPLSFIQNLKYVTHDLPWDFNLLFASVSYLRDTSKFAHQMSSFVVGNINSILQNKSVQ